MVNWATWDSATHRRVAAGAIFMGAGGLLFNVLPLLLGAAADSLQFENQMLGYLGSSFLVGFAGIPATLPLWLHRVNRSRLAVVAAVLLIASLATGALLSSFRELLLALFLAGTGGGILFSLAVEGLGQASDNQRAFMVGNAAMLGIAALWVWTVPVFILPSNGFMGGMLVSAAIAVPALALIAWLPKASEDVRGKGMARHTGSGSVMVWAGLAGIALFHVGIIGLWAYLERIGKAKGLSTEVVATAFAAEKVGVLIACAVSLVISRWLSKRIGLVISLTGVIAAVVLLATMEGMISYSVAVFVFGVFWCFAFPFQFAVISDADLSGRFAPMIPAFVGAGSSIGPALSGKLAAQGNYSSVYMMVVVTCAVGAGLLLLAATLLANKSTDIARGID